MYYIRYYILWMHPNSAQNLNLHIFFLGALMNLLVSLWSDRMVEKQLIFTFTFTFCFAYSFTSSTLKRQVSELSISFAAYTHLISGVLYGALIWLLWRWTWSGAPHIFCLSSWRQPYLDFDAHILLSGTTQSFIVCQTQPTAALGSRSFLDCGLMTPRWGLV